MRVPPEDYVMPECVMEVMKDYIENNYDFKVRIFSGNVDQVKFGLTMALTPRSKIAYIGTRKQLHPKCVQFISDRAHRRFWWQYFIRMKEGIYVFDPKTMLWGEFVEQMDQMMTGEKQQHECCICLEKEALMKCPQCTTRYCKKCISGQTINCFVCEAGIMHNAKTNHIMVQHANKITMNIGCLLKILHIKYNMPTLHMLRKCESEELTNLLVRLTTNQEFARYFDYNGYFTTVTMYVEHLGVSEEVMVAAATAEIPSDVLEALEKFKV